MSDHVRLFVSFPEELVDRGGVGDVVLRGESRPLVVLGGAVLRELGERQVRPRRCERCTRQLVLQRLQPGKVGAEGKDPEVGLVPEHREREDLMVAVDERVDRVEYSLGAARLLVGLAGVHSVEEVQHAPAGRRFDGFHEAQATGTGGEVSLVGLMLAK